MKARYSLNAGESEEFKEFCNASPGKFSIWWTMLTLGLQRKELHQGWLVITSERALFCKRHWLKQDLLGPLSPFIPSKRILWEIKISDIESISPRKCLGLYPIQRVRTNSPDLGNYDFGLRDKKIIATSNRLGIKYLS